MLQKQREVLEAGHVAINALNSEVHFGVGKHTRMELEAYCELRAGKFEIGRLGAFSYLGGGASIVRNVESIGRFCSVAPNLVAGPVEHPVDFVSAHCLFQGQWGGGWDVLREFYKCNGPMIRRSRELYDDRYSDEQCKIQIGNDVWIGENVFLRRGVTIGDGAVIGARSVVTKDVAPYEVVVGVPAKTLRLRFDQVLVERLINLQWWDYGLSILDGVDFTSIVSAIDTMERNIETGRAQRFCPPIKTVMEDGRIL